jgi:ribonuclease HI
MKILYTDGGCTNNNQTDVAKRVMSVAVVDDRGDELLVLNEECGGSNNIAEFLAVKEALTWVKQQGYKELQIRTDSKSNLSWAEGRIGAKINDRERVWRTYNEIAALRREIKVELRWIPREHNSAGIFLDAMIPLP